MESKRRIVPNLHSSDVPENLFPQRFLTWGSLENHHLDVGNIHIFFQWLLHFSLVTVRFSGGVSPWPKNCILEASFEPKGYRVKSYSPWIPQKFQVPRKEVYCTFIMPILEVGGFPYKGWYDLDLSPTYRMQFFGSFAVVFFGGGSHDPKNIICNPSGDDCILVWGWGVRSDPTYDGFFFLPRGGTFVATWPTWVTCLPELWCL